MANSWPKQPRLLGKKFRRLDGPEKATGRAKYSYDMNPKGLLHAFMLRSPYPHARITDLDTSDAEKMPGVKAIHVVAGKGKELFYAGDEILAIAADTEEHAHDALRAVRIKYEQLPFFVKEEDVLKNPQADTVPPVGGKRQNLRPGGENTKQENDKEGAIDAAFKEAHAVVEGDYGIPVICHQCLEPHGLVAQWDEDGSNLTVWCSTQAVPGTADELAKYFKVPSSQVRCITHYMGGGYGSKFGPDIQGTVAAELARKAKAPVKLMLDRESEITTGGNRPSAYGKIKMAATKDGKITAYEFEGYGTSGVSNSPGVNIGQLPYVYGDAIPNVRSRNRVCGTNGGGQRAMRAPGHPQMCVLTEWPLDDLAAKLGMDPLQVRLKNLPPNDPDAVQNDPQSYNALRHTIYTEEIKKAAELAGWDKKWHPPGEGPGKGPVKHGIGMAIHTWGGAGYPPNDITVTIASDGSVLVEGSTQDLGTGERTVLALIVAEVLGLETKDVTVRIGESQYGRSTGSGGSTTTPGTSPAALNAVVAARDSLFKAIAKRLDAKPEDLSIEPGKVASKDKSWSWREACARLGMDVFKGTGNFTPGLSNQGVGGVQIAEVAVDTETGVVRCTRVVAVQDCGRIINEQGCISQVCGGVIMAVNAAVIEERIMDRHTGRQVNPNMEFYKIGGIKDMPEIVVHMHHMPDRGVIGIGEPPTISTCAAIGNAVFNAIGVRVPYGPFSPDRVLAALSKKGGKV